jgi:hypothetical protein
MKNIFFVAAALFVLSSCSDYLDEENKSNILTNEYYRTAAGYESLVNSTYSSLRDVYDAPWIFLAGTDLFVEGRNAQPEGLSEYRNLSSTDQNVIDFYTVTYRGIQRANAAIYYYDKTEKTSTLDNRYGEVRFLRAYYYFLLVQNFGGVSIVEDLIDEPVTSFHRNTAEEVYTFIINEMNAALDLVPENAAQFGRVSKKAIRHFLAKVYLTRGYEAFAAADDFTKAAALADEAIAGQALSISFEDLFWPGKEKNAEILFSIQYSKASMKDLLSDGTNQNYWFGPYMGGEGTKNGYPYRSYTLMPTWHVFNLYTPADSRWEGTFMNVFYSRYYDFYDKAKADRPTLNIAYYYPQKWELADTAAWRAADVAHRAKTKIIPYDSTVWVGTPGTGIDNGKPAVRKFDDPTSSFSLNGSSQRDVYLARLGETYLIAAEAYFKLSQPGTAADRINEVRRRAAKPGMAGDMVITAADVTIDFILDERARELLGEYDRWLDLKRTGRLKDRTKWYNRDIRNKYFNNGIDPFKGVNGEDKILRPIPQKTLDSNTDDSFGQNPGY